MDRIHPPKTAENLEKFLLPFHNGRAAQVFRSKAVDQYVLSKVRQHFAGACHPGQKNDFAFTHICIPPCAGIIQFIPVVAKEIIENSNIITYDKQKV